MNEEDLQQIVEPWFNKTGQKFKKEVSFVSGATRADYVTKSKDGTLRCFELKSDKDNEKRLEKQTYIYSLYFKEVYLICSYRKLDLYLNCLDKHVGVIYVNRNNKIKIYRKSHESESFDKFNLIYNLPLSLIKQLGYEDFLGAKEDLTLSQAEFLYSKTVLGL